MRFDDAHCIHMRAPNTRCLVCSQLVLTSAYKMRSTCALMKRPVVIFWKTSRVLRTAPDGICQEEKETVHSKQARNIIQSIYLYENATDSIFKCDPRTSLSNLLIPSCAFPVRLSFSWPQCVLPHFNFNLSVSCSPILRHCLSCPLATVCRRFPSYVFFLSLLHLHINPRPSRLPSRGAGNGEKVAKAWLRCQFINTAPRETARMKAPMPLENYPPNRGKSFATRWSKMTNTQTQACTQNERCKL